MSRADTQSPLQAAVTGSRLPPLRGSECHQSGQRAAFQSFCPLPPESLAYFQNDFFPPDLSHFPFRIPLIYHPRSFFPEASLDPFDWKRTPLPSYGGRRDFPHGAVVGVSRGGRDEGLQPGSTTEICFLTVPGWKSKIKVLAGSVSPEASLSDAQTSLCVLTGPSLREHTSWNLFLLLGGQQSEGIRPTRDLV